MLTADDCALIAGIAVHAAVIRIIRGAVEFALFAVAADYADFRGGEAGEYAEQHGEGVSVFQPDMLAVEQHAAECIDGIGDDDDAEVAGDDGAGIDVFEPDEGEEGSERGHRVPACGVWARRGHAGSGAFQQPFRPLVERLPRIYEHPEVAEEGGDVAHADPPDYPDEGGG